MSGFSGHAVRHLVRRGVEATTGFVQDSEYMQLQQDARLYEDANFELSPLAVLPIIGTAVFFILLLVSIRYTLGEVVASLAMIESPTSTLLVEPKSSDLDASSEKQPLMGEQDVELTLIPHRPLTSNLRSTIVHLHRIGGFHARWRGLGASIVYHMTHGFAVALFSGFFPIPGPLSFVMASVLLARIHMTWTHVMISQSSAKPWFKRIVPGRHVFKVLALPSLVFALAQQATCFLPIGVALALDLPEQISQAKNLGEISNADFAVLALKVLAVPATALLVAISVLLPASVTLTRIEASLLPEDEDTIVPFDRTLNGALPAAISLDENGEPVPCTRKACRALFVEAWRSFDRAARLRLVKFYVKMLMAMLFVAWVGLHVVGLEIFLIGGQKLAVLARAGSAQMRLAAMENRGGM
ncbi:hypothetical protein LTR50_001756 [Elasticomyces elasticus]|nr:hypothetical protein LTR50_001756 [Elasticomyces elasticus]